MTAEAGNQLRVRVGADLPQHVRDAINMLRKSCRSEMATVRIPDVPRSCNHQYVRTRRGQRLDDSITDFRWQVKAAVKSPILVYGQAACVIAFFSPEWVTKKRTIRMMDIDNRIKAVLDALKHAAGFQDERIWQISAFKVAATKKQTHVWMFDMGDVVDFCSGEGLWPEV